MRSRIDKGSLLVLIAVVVLLLGALALDKLASTMRGDHPANWNLYAGRFETQDETYDVEIDDADKGNGIHRLVHLRIAGETSLKGITGHDYNGDGKWDRVFYCGEHEMIGQPPEGMGFGCNSVVRTPEGWRFEPCPADEGIVQPFSDMAISFAMAELDTAMKQMHNNDHLSERWEWSPEQQKTVKVFDKRSR